MILMKPTAVIEAGPTGEEALRTLEAAGRTCYKSEGKSDGTHEGAAAFVRRIIERGHESVLEHVGWTVRFICDRGVTHEMVRHRIVAFSQESTRYCDYAKAGSEGGGHVQFIIPPWVDSNVIPGTYERQHMTSISGEVTLSGRLVVNEDTVDTLFTVSSFSWLQAMLLAEKSYQDLRGKGWSPQQARSVLPNSTKTEIVMTCNAREWRHVIRLRTGKSAHPQMREVMSIAARALYDRCPTLFRDVWEG